MYLGVVVLAFLTVIVGVFGAVPADTLRTDENDVSTLVIDPLNVTDTYWFTVGGTTYNMTEVIVGLLGVNATNEWNLVYGTTGDWFNYTDITYTPVYIGLQMHPLNITYDSVLVLPVVYDKDATHWQLALYWVNGTQITDNTDLLVMYYAHVDWDNVDGLEYLEPNGEPA
jgi:hypothetical protein